MTQVLHATFQILVITSIIIVLVQIRTMDILDHMRNHQTNRWIFYVRRTAMFTKLGALAWTVIFAYQNNWTPWPPFVAFLAAFDVYVVAHILIMRIDLARTSRSQGMPVPSL